MVGSYNSRGVDERREVAFTKIPSESIYFLLTTVDDLAVAEDIPFKLANPLPPRQVLGFDLQVVLCEIVVCGVKTANLRTCEVDDGAVDRDEGEEIDAFGWHLMSVPVG
jgi:hypothetical protein